MSNNSMARGKIQIKRIENTTNRQVTYSKRRNGLFKKAYELTVLCDAKVSIIMLSTTGRFHEFTSPSTTTKQMLDEYQKTHRVDLWGSQYEKMQETLRDLKEVNMNLKKEIRQRLGEGLNDVRVEELPGLEQDIDNCLRIIRQRKFKKLSDQIDIRKKKVRNEEKKNKHFQSGIIINAKEEDEQYELVGDEEGHYDSVIGFENGDSGMFTLRLQPN